MSVTLCGFPASNYYCKVNLALLEKQVPFTEELLIPTQDAAFLDLSPRGKIPVLKVNGATLTESQVIDEYLEDAYPAVPLYPADPFARARCRELVVILELYIELVARRLFPSALFGLPMQPGLKDAVAIELKQGVAALQRRARFAPFIAGEQMTHADIAAVFHLPLAARVAQITYGEDCLADIAGYPAWLEMMRARPHVAAVKAKSDAAAPAFIASVRKRFGTA